MPRRPTRIVLAYPWPFPLMSRGGQLLPVVIQRPKPKRLRKVPPPSQWVQGSLIPEAIKNRPQRTGEP